MLPPTFEEKKALREQEVVIDMERYLESKGIDNNRKFALLSIVNACLVKIQSGGLTPDQIQTLQGYIQEIYQLFEWIAQITQYVEHIRAQIRNAQTDIELDSITWDFLQFDSSFIDVSVADKIAYLGGL